MSNNVIKNVSARCVLYHNVAKDLFKISASCKSSISSFHTDNHNNRESNQRKSQQWSLGFLSLGGLLTAYYFTSKKSYVAQAAESDPRSAFIGSGGVRGGASRRGIYNFIADVVQKASPAVVHIERMVNIPFTRRPVSVSNGSGFIVDANGLIITNAHVVGNQASVNVKLQDGRQTEGQVVGIDEARDIAAVRIQMSNLPHIPLGTTRDLRPGEWVVAIGSPLALKNTVTAGIVSNMCRAGKELGLHEEKGDMEYIQTDATINVGNSGGPLVNLDGQVIGINTMMASVGIGFAIPIDYVRQFLDQLRSLEQGCSSRTIQSNRRWIGITMLTLTPDIVMQLKARKPGFPDVSQGVMVHRVQPESPAYMGGMQDGDVITHINGRAIQSTKDVFEILKQSQILNINVKRGNRTIYMRVVAEEVVH